MILKERTNEMSALIEKWKVSGMNQVDFARIHQINVLTLRYWITKQKKEVRQPTSDFIELKNFPGQEMSIHYPNGVELVVSAQCPISVLRSLINL